MRVNLGIIGLGRYGTGLAQALSYKPELNILAGIDTDIEGEGYLAEAKRTNKNPRYTGDYQLSEKVRFCNLREAAEKSDLIIVTIPVLHLRESVRKWGYSVRPDAIICSGIKGIEYSTFMRPTKVIRSVMKEYGKTALESKKQYAAISGPTFADELIQGKPLSAVIAADKRELSDKVRKMLSVPGRLNLHSWTDLKGTEYAGSLKNVIAIGGGCITELGFGEGAKASFLTYGINEVKNMLELFGCDKETMLTLAGIGDLIMTSSSDKSRNFSSGRLLATTGKIEYGSSKGFVEGVNTAKAIHDLFYDNKAMGYARRNFRIFVDVYRATHEANDPSNVMDIFRNLLIYYETRRFTMMNNIVKNPVQRLMFKRRFRKRYDPTKDQS